MAFFNWDTKKDMLEAFKSPAERTTLGSDYSKQVSARKLASMHSKMMENERTGLMTHEDHKRFIEEDYATLERDFYDGKISGQQFNDDADRHYDHFVATHKKRCNPFDWSTGDSNE